MPNILHYYAFYRFYDLGTQICKKIEEGGRFEEACVWLILVQCLLALDYLDTELSDVDADASTNKLVFGNIRPTSIYVDLQGIRT